MDLVILDLEGKVSYTDYFVLVTGSSDRHAQAIADRIELKLKKEYQRMAISIEGYQEAHWVLMDYGDVVVHIFLSEEREFYDLETMWKDVPRISEKQLLQSS
ncbi:MAG: ribosome silencing factor [Deltaproteobacteria bacterium]|nr:ribosome silencing factor [Deltaproteobacteria bacterium]